MKAITRQTLMKAIIGRTQGVYPCHALIWADRELLVQKSETVLCRVARC